MKVAFIGLGNMGASLAKAVAKEVASPDLLLVNRSPQKVEAFISQYGGTASDPEQVFQEAEVIFLGVKPYQICPLLEEYQGILAQRSNLLLVSMAAGLELEKMACVVKNERVGLIRIMPNTPVAIGQGVISLARSQAVTDQQVVQVKELLAGAGALYEMEEKLMDSATAVAGCGPAFSRNSFTLPKSDSSVLPHLGHLNCSPNIYFILVPQSGHILVRSYLCALILRSSVSPLPADFDFGKAITINPFHHPLRLRFLYLS